ncbi:Rho-type gtpase-activating protein [Thecaphora frezii]
MALSNSIPDGPQDVADDQLVMGFNQDGELEEAYCGGCHRLIGEDSVEEGVIQFATKLWHVDCFRCAKCKNKVSTDRDDILLLSDGHPICGDCNYSCNICNLPIMEEAIMTGDESYHASCFTCRACHSKIEELVFAKTSQGIYCMPCHNQRVARSRKHAEQRRAKLKREKQKQEVEEALKASSSQDTDMLRVSGSGRTASGDSAGHGTPSGMPSISLNDGAARDGDSQPPSPPAKESPAARSPGGAPPPVASQSSSTLGSSSSLSPYLGTGSPSMPRRPGSVNSKRPMQAPPPPIRESRGPSSPRPGQGQEFRRVSPSSPSTARFNENLAETMTPSGSTSSLSTAITSMQIRSSSPAPDRGQNKANPLISESAAEGVSGSREPEHHGANGKPEPTKKADSVVVSPSVNGFSLDSQIRSQFSSGSDYSQDTEGAAARSRSSLAAGSATTPALQLSAAKNRKPAAVSHLMPASNSNQRLSKTFSFYDPDFIQLMDSFGRFDSNDNFQLSSPMLEEDPEASSMLVPETATKTSRAAKRNSIRPPMKPESSDAAEEMASDRSRQEQPLSSPPAAVGEVPSDNEEEVLRDEREASEELEEDAGMGLSGLTAKMRASMQQATNGHVSMDISFVETILKDLDETREKMQALQTKYDRIKRASQQAAQGFSMAKEEFAHEVNARHEAEMEMARLRRQLVEQATKLAALSSEKRQQEQLERRSQDVRASLKGMERDLTKLTVERDLTVAEVAELMALQGSSSPLKENNGATLKGKENIITDNLAKRLESVKAKYREEIDELSLERDSLLIEIEELKQSRELFLEEAQTLNAKNEELTLVYSQMTRRIEKASQARDQLPALPRTSKDLPPSQYQSGTNKAGGGFGFGFNKPSKQHAGSGSIGSANESLATSASLQQQTNDSLAYIDSAVQRTVKPEKIEPAPMAKKFKWMKPKLTDASKVANSHATSNGSNGSQPPVPPKMSVSANTQHVIAAGKPSHDLVVREHLFQPFNVLRPTRCVACQKNMWGQSEMRCAICSQVCHSKCLQNLSLSCNQPYTRPEDAGQEVQTGPSMFGRDLVEQAEAENREVPLVVDKCIQAVEAFGMDYEGIYRKSGGSSQLKVITQLFERGAAFDLEDVDRFNDVSAITSVLKNYFRELPVPLLTFELHEDFIRLAEAKLDGAAKAQQMGALIEKLPKPHYSTLKSLVLHLHRVQQRSEENRMNARNLGVVFGPTLMKSGDPAQEFAHMGGKAMTIEYFIEHAEELFA